ncbi:MAG: hypothetical protein ACOYLF_12135 [Blastocatellia bacterium]
MHNIDRTTLETSFDEFADEFAFNNEYSEEFENFGESIQESPFNESQEMELAAELLTVTNEAELDQFLGNLFRQASRAVGSFMRSPVGQVVGQSLRGVARAALPKVGSMLGNLVLPGVGGVIGGKLAGAAGNMLGLELSGLNEQDREFEMARQFVRFAGSAVGNAALAPANQPPRAIAQSALTTAAQQYAPGLLVPQSSPQPSRSVNRCSHATSGRWVRRGDKIIIIGA